MSNPEKNHEEYRHIPLVRLKTVREKNLIYHGEKLISPEEAAKFIRPFIGDTDREYVAVCCTDVKMRPVSVEIVAIGTLSMCPVEPREVLKNAILSNCSQILLFHTNPSEIPEPSEADYAVTQRLKKAGELLGIPLIEHIILGENGIYSYQSEGKI